MDEELLLKATKVFKSSKKNPLNNFDSAEAVFNLKGFAEVLLKMRKEVEQNAK